MNKTNIISAHKNIINALVNKNIAPALLSLRSLINNAQSDELLVLLDNYERTYSLILDYTIKGVKDPQRPLIYAQLIKSLIELSDKTKCHLINNLSSGIYYQKKGIAAQGKILSVRLREILEESHINNELSDFLTEVSMSDSEEVENKMNYTHDLFDYVWHNTSFSDSDKELLKTFFRSTGFETPHKALIVSALTLSCIDVFDKNKIVFLSELFSNSALQIKERAFAGLMYVLYLYDNYLPYYPELEKMLKKINKDPVIESYLEFFLIQNIKAKDTEKFTRKMQEEIIPDIIKHAPKIHERLELDNILPDDIEGEKNPDWQKILEDAPDLMNKLEELSKLQLEGTDVFMSTFAMLKNFPFFHVIPNWLVPFYKDNPHVIKAMQNEDEEFRDTFLTALEKSGHMCNSDKYSFCLNVNGLPDAQKKMMLQMFKAELDSINEVLSEDNRINETFLSKTIFTQYIQDLYRLFKLNPQKGEMQDIFLLELDFHNCSFFSSHFLHKSVLIKLVDFYFDNGHFEQAAQIYKTLIAQGMNTQVVFEKMGFAYQQLKKYHEAVDAYKKAELFEATTWIYSKLAFCYTQLGAYDEALAYYHDAEKLEPDNLKIQLQIANTYLNKGNTEIALNHYFKLEFLSGENAKVLRPIAWCLFILQRPDEAGKYFDLLMQSREANKYDYINYGHWLWCTGQIKKAAEAYLNSIKQKDNTFEAFLKSFKEDEKYLFMYGISTDDIPLMLDYLALNCK